MHRDDTRPVSMAAVELGRRTRGIEALDEPRLGRTRWAVPGEPTAVVA